MKTYMLVVVLGLLSVSCNGQNNETKKPATKQSDEKLVEEPKGSWKVDREFDKNGNLIRYDSIYSWSSHNKFDHLTSSERDSLMQSFKSRFFRNFTGFENQGFEAIFSQDSLFNKHYFNDGFFESDFGRDLMNIDDIRERMIARQKKFLEKYQSDSSRPEDEN